MTEYDRVSPTLCGENVTYTLPPSTVFEISPDARFLWLDPKRHSEGLQIPVTTFDHSRTGEFTAVEFRRSLTYPAGSHPVAQIALFADTKFRLYVNQRFVGIGPVTAGGDFSNTLPMPRQYYNCYEWPLEEVGGTADFRIEVHTKGAVMTDYSCGRGGMIFSCSIRYEDREPLTLVSDETWQVRLCPRQKSATVYDETLPQPAWEPAVSIPAADCPWNLCPADILMLTEETVVPQDIAVTQQDGGVRYRFTFDRIYSAYLCATVEKTGDAPLPVTFWISELEEPSPAQPSEQLCVQSNTLHYRGLRMWSIGEVTAFAPLLPDGTAPQIRLHLQFQHYPYDPEMLGDFTCSEPMLNRIYRLGRKTLELCRQTQHLDSPLHQEPLACTGDYAIESRMTHMTYGDLRLTRLDLLRTADTLCMTDGVMFHTSYSLIFVLMATDYYRFTADRALLEDCMPALEALLRRFTRYCREDGLVDSPPNYMFVDWAKIDGYDMHHPPKALGQTVLNAFYRMALQEAAQWYAWLGRETEAAALRRTAERHKKACNAALYDTAQALYCDGLPDESPQTPPWLPANTAKRYHSRHANTLAVLSGLIEGEAAKKLLLRILREESLDGGQTVIEMQPYFLFYLLEAVEKYGLFAPYGLDLCRMWERAVRFTEKGLKEVWEETAGDCSHAWGAAPTYFLPQALLGLQMEEPGFARFRLRPQLYGLSFAEIRMPTPYGMLICRMEESAEPQITLPSVFLREPDGSYRLRKNGEPHGAPAQPSHHHERKVTDYGTSDS